MKYFQKILEGIDVAPMVAELDAHPELWNQHSARKARADSPHSQMSDVWLRYNDPRNLKSPDDPAFNLEHDSVWYPAGRALPRLQAAAFALMGVVRGERLGGVLITKIPPGCGIAPHSDHGWHVEKYDKFYLSLKSAPGATFHCGEETINPKPGDVYRFDNRMEHWVKNESAEDRVTLIVCIQTEMFTGPKEN